MLSFSFPSETPVIQMLDRSLETLTFVREGFISVPIEVNQTW